jgi:hypothetical protein
MYCCLLCPFRKHLMNVVSLKQDLTRLQEYIDVWNIVHLLMKCEKLTVLGRAKVLVEGSILNTDDEYLCTTSSPIISCHRHNLSV